jgi:hypothetical protein
VVLMSAAFAAGEIGGGNVSDSLDGDTVKGALLGLIFVCGIAIVLVLRTVKKQTTRFVLIGALALLGVGLYFQRTRLDDCADQCTCRVLGQDVDVSGPGAICPEE